LARWVPALHTRRPLDLTKPRRDGRVVLAAQGRLFLLTGVRELEPFAHGRKGYSTAPGPEPYIALSPRHRHRRAGCSFAPDEVYALEPGQSPGVVRVDARGHAHGFARIAGAGLPNGIAFDETGRFGHRLLATATAGDVTSVFAIDCRGRVVAVTRHAPRVEGGIAVAPRSFGRYAGQLIAADEKSGRIVAIAPNGSARTVVRSELPAGPDIGVESAGFVPRGFDRRGAAYVADRASPGSPHPGTDSILTLGGAELLRAGVRAGDLLVASEGGAGTVAVRCRRRCVVRRVADGPATAHVEGHIIFLAPMSSRRQPARRAR
jgi:hypothetical protein